MPIVPSTSSSTAVATSAPTLTAGGRRWRMARHVAVAALAAGLAMGATACSTTGSGDGPRNPTDVNVDADDVLPPAEAPATGSGVEVDGMDDEGM
jgi:hypothetical protein